jgi:hypothetical protein
VPKGTLEHHSRIPPTAGTSEKRSTHSPRSLLRQQSRLHAQTAAVQHKNALAIWADPKPLSCGAIATVQPQPAQSTTAGHRNRQVRVKGMHQTHPHTLLQQRSLVCTQTAAVQHKCALSIQAKRFFHALPLRECTTRQPNAARLTGMSGSHAPSSPPASEIRLHSNSCIQSQTSACRSSGLEASNMRCHCNSPAHLQLSIAAVRDHRGQVLYERQEAQCIGCNTRAFNHQITCLLLSAYMAGSNQLCSPAQAVYST